MPSSTNWLTIQASTFNFRNKFILVTGAADGIGRAVTLALAQQGATVLMLDKKTRHLEKLYDQIKQLNAAEPIILPVDLLELNEQSVTVLANAIKQDIGQLDGLLHNAGELGSPSPMDQYDMDYWHKVMQINLHAPYLLTRALLPLLKQDTQTNILFTSADCARHVSAYWGAYSIAYAGIEAQMKLWAEELENVSHIKINSVDPGPVRTSLRRRSHPGESQDSLITPQQIAPAYLSLLDENNPYHGQQLSLQN